jgi:hypothetical protein
MLAVIVLIAPWRAIQKAAVGFAMVLGRRPGVTALISFILLSVGSVVVYHSFPLAMDESAPYMQARIFASGHLLGRVQPQLLDWLIPIDFQDYFIGLDRETGQIASKYWPGFAMLLTPFTALGIPWACNPLIGAASIWVIHRLAFELTDSVEAAGTAVLFTLASAAVAINAMSFYSMPAHLLCNAAYVLLLWRPTPAKALAAGLIGGLALNLHNPTRHALFAIPWILWLVWGRQWRILVMLCVGYLPWVLIGVGWYYVLRDLHSGNIVMQVSAPPGGWSFLWNILRSAFEAPSPDQVAYQAIYLSKAWLWASPLLPLLAYLGYREQSRRTVVWLLLASLLLTLVTRIFVPMTQGHGWGYRFLHPVWFVLPLFAALAVVPAGKIAGLHGRMLTNAVAWSRAGALGALALLLPLFCWQVNRFIGGQLDLVPVAESGRPRVLLVRASNYYASDLIQNDPFLREPVTIMISLGRYRDGEMLSTSFPDLQLLGADSRGSVWGYPDADGDASHQR